MKCEDSYRYFEKPKEMAAWMDTYCDSEWMSCPYAKDMMDAYDAQERGDAEAVDRQKDEARQKEYIAMITRVGKAEEKMKELTKAVHDLEVENAVLRSKIDDLSEEKARVDKILDKELKRRRTAEKGLDDVSSKIYAQMQEISRFYEDRICYFLDTYCGGKVEENVIREWAEGKSFALTAEGEAGHRVWVVLFDDKKGGEDESGDADRKID